MAERRKIALIYDYNENWIGGTYYIQNLITAISGTDDLVKPELVIFCSDEKVFRNLLQSINYPYLSFRKNYPKFTFFQKAIHKISKLGFDKENLNPYNEDIDLVFPATIESNFSKKTIKLFWIPDFQEHYLPQFFNEEEIRIRKSYQREIIKKGEFIVFSSHAAKEDFNSLYKENNLKQFVMPFAVSNPTISEQSFQDLRSKYSLPEKYFICCNQFWQHKNHKLILETLNFLKKSGNKIFIAFTGKEHDYRNPNYFGELKAIAEKLEVTDCIRFLGFINREDQLGLMKNALAVVQPSLFEGWGTVIEDSKSLGIKIIASDINVHKEQLTEYPKSQLFANNNVSSLAECILHSDYKEESKYNYDDDILKFGKTFQKILSEIF